MRVRPASPSTVARKAKSTGDLVKLISKKTGIPEETAEEVLDAVLGYLEKNLPERLGGAVEMLLGGAGTADGTELDDLLGGSWVSSIRLEMSGVIRQRGGRGRCEAGKRMLVQATDLRPRRRAWPCCQCQAATRSWVTLPRAEG